MKPDWVDALTSRCHDLNLNDEECDEARIATLRMGLHFAGSVNRFLVRHLLLKRSKYWDDAESERSAHQIIGWCNLVHHHFVLSTLAMPDEALEASLNLVSMLATHEPELVERPYRLFDYEGERRDEVEREVKETMLRMMESTMTKEAVEILMATKRSLLSECLLAISRVLIKAFGESSTAQP